MKKPNIHLLVTNNSNITFAYPSDIKDESWAKELTSTDFPSSNHTYFAYRKVPQGNTYSIVLSDGKESTALTLFTGQWKANKGKNMLEALEELAAMLISNKQCDTTAIREKIYFLASTFVSDTIPAGNSNESVVYTYDNANQLEQLMTNTLHAEGIAGKRVLMAEADNDITTLFDNHTAPVRMVYTINSSKITSGVAVDKDYVAEGEKLKLTYTKDGDYQPIEVEVDIDGISNQYLLYNGSEILIRAIHSSLQFSTLMPEPQPAPVAVEEFVEEEVPESQVASTIIVEEDNNDSADDIPSTQESKAKYILPPLLTFVLGLAVGAGVMYLFPQLSSNSTEVTHKIAEETIKDTVIVTKHDTISYSDTIKINGDTKVVYKNVDRTVYKDKPVYIKKDEPEEHFDRNAYRPADESTRIDGTESSATPQIQGHGPSYPGGDEAMNRAVRSKLKNAHLVAQQGNGNATVMVEFTVEADGRISNIIAKGHPQLKTDVANAVKQLHFEPSNNGTTTKKTVTVPFRVQ